MPLTATTALILCFGIAVPFCARQSLHFAGTSTLKATQRQRLTRVPFVTASLLWVGATTWRRSMPTTTTTTTTTAGSGHWRQSPRRSPSTNRLGLRVVCWRDPFFFFVSASTAVAASTRLSSFLSGIGSGGGPFLSSHLSRTVLAVPSPNRLGICFF
ncbi:hypothetical protein pneo_cds_331 [Pandoravirus neocaledonia]|uniref:Uncharacterized protein n=1 Tax=Pandoravirus neocaledonia TaxID=2107708 RepID=A0A2U7UBU8_9VIRU|nr:hypothetical protein pneo_cds_331 [Pandoravirus neocaledonia]AVK75938.1 hypothetical protein pneo_cds_331 [Pandoravirus neocaledonia]